MNDCCKAWLKIKPGYGIHMWISFRDYEVAQPVIGTCCFGGWPGNKTKSFLASSRPALPRSMYAVFFSKIEFFFKAVHFLGWKFIIITLCIPGKYCKIKGLFLLLCCLIWCFAYMWLACLNGGVVFVRSISHIPLFCCCSTQYIGINQHAKAASSLQLLQSDPGICYFPYGITCVVVWLGRYLCWKNFSGTFFDGGGRRGITHWMQIGLWVQNQIKCLYFQSVWVNQVHFLCDF